MAWTFKVSAIDETNKLIYVQDERISAAKAFSQAWVRRHSDSVTLPNSFFSELENAFYSFTTPLKEEFFLTEIIDKKYLRAN